VAAKEKLIRKGSRRSSALRVMSPSYGSLTLGSTGSFCAPSSSRKPTRSPRQTMHTFQRNWPMFLKSCWRRPPISVSMLAAREAALGQSR
jgi:hypothetical protein